MNAASVLVVIGIHREELAFGREVLGGLDPGEVDVLEIPEGLSGRRPLPDECFRHRALHRALYLQLLPHLDPGHRLLVDLHAGFDDAGPSADLLCAQASLQSRLALALEATSMPGCGEAMTTLRECVRVITLDPRQPVHASTVIPEAVWNNPGFAYLGVEVYLPDDAQGRARGVVLARRVIRLAGRCAQDVLPA